MTERETKERVLLLLALLVLLLFLFLLFLLLLLSVALYEQKTIRNSVNRPRETRKTITWMVKHDLKNNLPLQRPSLFSPFSSLASFPFLFLLLYTEKLPWLILFCLICNTYSTYLVDFPPHAIFFCWLRCNFFSPFFFFTTFSFSFWLSGLIGGDCEVV